MPILPTKYSIINDMTAQKDNSSLPLLLAISGTAVLSVAIGWLLLDPNAPPQFDPSQGPSVELLEQSSVEPALDAPVTDIDANFRKARLAAEADILAYPPRQSALHFYGRILAIEPEHVIANAELDAVLGRISAKVAEHLTAEEFGDAYELASLVAKVRPDHALVHEVQQTMDESAGELVSQAMQSAQNGNDNGAATALAAAAALPGAQRDYVEAVRDSISEIQTSRKAAEFTKNKKRSLAAAKALKDKVAQFRNAIDLGQLVTPPGDNALDYLAEMRTPDEQKEQLTGELVDALIAESKTNIGQGLLPTTETLLDTADELAGDRAELAELRDSLERAYIDAEENKLISTAKLIRLNTAQPHYPQRARARAISGWVEVKFTVTTSGQTDNIEVSRSEPQRIFDAAAVEAVQQWTFEPRVFRGQRIDQRSAVRLVFNLD
ncbi:MAG: energy transducer TonB [Woeseiaceae bacterium]